MYVKVPLKTLYTISSALSMSVSTESTDKGDMHERCEITVRQKLIQSNEKQTEILVSFFKVKLSMHILYVAAYSVNLPSSLFQLCSLSVRLLWRHIGVYQGCCTNNSSNIDRSPDYNALVFLKYFVTVILVKNLTLHRVGIEWLAIQWK